MRLYESVGLIDTSNGAWILVIMKFSTITNLLGMITDVLYVIFFLKAWKNMPVNKNYDLASSNSEPRWARSTSCCHDLKKLKRPDSVKIVRFCILLFRLTSVSISTGIFNARPVKLYLESIWFDSVSESLTLNLQHTRTVEFTIPISYGP